MPELNQPDAQNHGRDMRVFTVVVCNTAGLFRGWRVTGNGWRVTGSGWRVTGSGWRVTGSG